MTSNKFGQDVISSSVDSDSKLVAIPGTNYRIGQTPVTQRLYEKVMGENPSEFQLSNDILDDDKLEALKAEGDTSNNPVDNVSWYDAVYFCNKLSIMEGLTPAYSVDGKTDPDRWDYTPHSESKIDSLVVCDFSANGYRLPTNKEWDDAAYGNKCYLYSGSNDLDEAGWYEDNSNGVTHPVAQKEPNDYGIYDMCGNVVEWVWDGNEPMSENWAREFCKNSGIEWDEDTAAALRISNDEDGIGRGGDCNSEAEFCDVPESTNYEREKGNLGDIVGFRLLRLLEPVKQEKRDGLKEVVSIGVDTDSKLVKIPGTDYRMGQTPVTQRLYKKVMGENPSHYQISSNIIFKFFQRIAYNLEKEEDMSNYPVEQVSWYDAVCFCNKLSIMEGLTPAYSVDGKTDPEYWGYRPHQGKIIDSDVECDFDANGYRLPNNREWEYAAKGGEDYKYPGSDNLDEVGWYNGNSKEVTHPVAKKKPNGYGLYDMCGNVKEWMWDRGGKDCSPDERCEHGGDIHIEGDFDVFYRTAMKTNDLSWGPNGFRLLRPLD